MINIYLLMRKTRLSNKIFPSFNIRSRYRNNNALLSQKSVTKVRHLKKNSDFDGSAESSK